MIHQIKNLERALFLVNIAKRVYGADPFLSVRNKANTMARAAISVQLRGYDEGYASIGKFFEKNYATIIHYTKKHKDWYEFDPQYRDYYNQFLLQIGRAINNEAWLLECIKKEVQKINRELVEFRYQPSQIIEFWNDAIQESLTKTP